MQFLDPARLDGTQAWIVPIGVQHFSGADVGRPDLQRARLRRSPEQVFAPDTLASFARLPIVLGDPSVAAVDATNWKRVAVGQLGERVARDGDHVRVPLVLMDAEAISDLKKGKREMSCGYTCDLDWTPGKTPDGEEFDASQIGIAGSYLAIVGQGRAGASCRTGGSWTAPSLFFNLWSTMMNDAELTAGAWGVREAMHERRLAAKDAELAELQRQLDARDGRLAALDAMGGKHGSGLADGRGSARDAHRAMCDHLNNAWKGGAAAR